MEIRFGQIIWQRRVARNPEFMNRKGQHEEQMGACLPFIVFFFRKTTINHIVATIIVARVQRTHTHT